MFAGYVSERTLFIPVFCRMVEKYGGKADIDTVFRMASVSSRI